MKYPKGLYKCIIVATFVLEVVEVTLNLSGKRVLEEWQFFKRSGPVSCTTLIRFKVFSKFAVAFTAYRPRRVFWKYYDRSSRATGHGCQEMAGICGEGRGGEGRGSVFWSHIRPRKYAVPGPGYRDVLKYHARKQREKGF